MKRTCQRRRARQRHGAHRARKPRDIQQAKMRAWDEPKQYGVSERHFLGMMFGRL